MAQLGTGADKGNVAGARLEISGTVQGVGFRPFIYRLARARGLTGHVANTPAGVIIELDGTGPQIEEFTRAIHREKPDLAIIEALQLTGLEPGAGAGRSCFTIVESLSAGEKTGPVTPDSDVCDNCLAELFDKADRRHLYPFINCTDCGPRFTLIEKIPYDRPLTAMKDFALCRRCRAEYSDPSDRRFHAQATCCPACGPAVRLTTPDGQTIGSDDPIVRAAALLEAGKILAIKGIGGFHLAVNAADRDAVARLRTRKGRPDKPLAVMVSDLERVRSLALFSPAEEKMLCSRAKPIVLLQKKTDFPLAANVAPDNRFIGVMLPYTPLHHLLFHHRDFAALVMTSGNLSGSPVIKDNDEALAKLGPIADCFLLHNRPIVSRTDDSVVRMAGNVPAVYRRARSFVPRVVSLPHDNGKTLALGALIKNTVCITRGREAFVSQHIGDLDNLDTQLHQVEMARHFRTLLRIEPDLLVHDLHPDYPGSRYARTQKKLPSVGVQHHHAHAVSCMAEHGLAGPVIAVTLDGNGYGPDRTVWGGEVLLADYHGFQRLAHLEPVPMPGGDAASREPWRMAFSHLYRAFGPEVERLDLQLLHDHAGKLPVLRQMIDRSINSPLTSSCGRLFDAVAALLGLCHTASFEGQAAAALEMLLAPGSSDAAPYAAAVADAGDFPWLLPVKPLVGAIVADIIEKVAPEKISRRFHHTLAALFTGACQKIRSRNSINRVVLSGGVFQNLYLLQLLTSHLEKEGFTVYSHRQVPANDGGIALGQALAGRAIYDSRETTAPEHVVHR